MGKKFLYLRRLHGHIHNFMQGFKLRKDFKRQFKENPNTVFLLMTPEHGNIGDHAIALAETRMLNEIGINYIEITGKQLSVMEWSHQLWAMNGFPILVTGGGNLGTLWFSLENRFRNIIKSNPKSTIVCLPNTIYYEKDVHGMKEFENSKQIYNRHKNLYLYARERTSYEVMKAAYKNVKLIPDVVLSLPAYKSNEERQGCLLCLRSDCEKTRTTQQESLLVSQCESLFPGNVQYTDMVVNHNVSIAQREKMVMEKLEEFSSVKLVVTDRLHGMIFCAISGTPCIVINSKSPKVLGCYNWIKDLPYIKVVDNISDIKSVYESIPKTGNEYSNNELNNYYEELKNDIKSLINYND